MHQAIARHTTYRPRAAKGSRRPSLFSVKAEKIFAGIDAAAANIAAIPAPAKPSRMDLIMAQAVAKLGAFPDGPARSRDGVTPPAAVPCDAPTEQRPHLFTARCVCGHVMGAHKMAVR